MGELFRRFWLPVMLSEELPAPDCPPVRARIMGEDLLGFRDSEGRVGLVDAYCPHRGAPLFFGRNEEGGLRCVYHGWKFDVEGRCLEIPNALEGETYREKVSLTAYPARDRGGLIWAYLGPPDRVPPMPAFGWLDLPADHYYVQKLVLECNYLQQAEGEMDPTHGAFLHRTLNDSNSFLFGINAANPDALDAMARCAVVKDTAYGVVNGMTRRGKGGNTIVNVNHCMLPSFNTAPIFAQGGRVTGPWQNNFRVPVDDEHVLLYRLRWQPDDPLSQQERFADMYEGVRFAEVLPGTFRMKENKQNDYLVDRSAQKNYSFTGIKSLIAQDVAIVEDQRGPLMDRTREHLVSEDEVIIRMRARMLSAARDLLEGQEPPEPFRPEVYSVRSANFALPEGESLEAAVMEHTRPVA
jgi:phenylpropionate dioxygenase-like ring-hydroxylating dioxygenase large terminal subunit